MGYAVGQSHLLNSSYRVAPAHDARSTVAGSVAHGLGYGQRAFREGSQLEHAHRAVPDNRLRIIDRLRIASSGFRAYIENAPANLVDILGHFVHAHRFRR